MRPEQAVGWTRQVAARPGREGLVLAVVLVLSLALAFLAHATLLVVRSEALVSHWEARRISGERSRAQVLGRIAGQMDSLAFTTTPIPQSGAPTAPGGAPSPTPRVRVVADRLSPEVLLLTASDPDFPGAPGLSILLWSPDPFARAEAREATVVSPGFAVSPGARLRLAPDSARCAPAGGHRRVHARGHRSGPGPATPGSPSPGAHPPPTTSWSAGDPPMIGPVGFTQLARRTGGFPDGLVLDSAMNGLVIVDGPVELLAGARLAGWLVSSGSVRVRSGAALSGAVDAAGRVSVEAGGSVTGDPCAHRRALEGAEWLRRPWRVGPKYWPQY